MENSEFKKFEDDFVNFDQEDFKELKQEAKKLTNQQQAEETVHNLQSAYIGKQSMARGQSRITGAKEMRHNKAKLGSKVWWKPNDAETQMNKKISDSLALTKKATAYTLDLYKVLQAKAGEGKLITTTFAEAEENIQNEDVQTLSKVHFTAKMFNGSYIKTHFSELYDYILSYRRLKEKLNKTPEEERIMNSVAPKMKLLDKRVNQFARENRLSLTSDNGQVQVLADDEGLSMNQIVTEVDMRTWMRLTSQEKSIRKADRKEEALQRPLALEDAKITEALATEKEVYSDDQMEEFKNREKNDLQFFVYSDEELIGHLSELNQSIAALGMQYLDKEIDNEEKIKIRKMIVELDALRKLAYARLKYWSGAGNEKEVLEYFEEVRRIKKRKQQEGMPDLVVEETLPDKYKKMTRAEATDTDSDNASYEARVGLLEKLETWKTSIDNKEDLQPEDKNMADKLAAAFRSYFDGNQYVVGHEEEERRMKAVQKLIKEIETDQKWERLKGDQFTGLKNGIDALTLGGLDTEAAEENGHEIINLIFSNGRPVDEGEFSKSVSFRDGAMHNPVMRTWVDRKNDPLFAHEPTVNDLRQGKISNCWMVAGVSTLAEFDPSIIKNCMRDNGNGTVTVRLYSKVQKEPGGAYSAWPVYVTVKKETPKLITGGAILTDGPLWMSMLERAFAHLGQNSLGEKRGYRSLWYGTPGDMVFALTGRVSEDMYKYNLNLAMEYDGKNLEHTGGSMENPEVQQALFNEFATAKSRGVIMTCGTKEKDMTIKGLNAGHAYIILGAEEIDGEKYVTLRNPYSNMTLVYDKDGQASMEGSYVSSSVSESCGQFKIKFKDFLDNMSGFSRTNLKKEIKYADDKPADQSVIHKPVQDQN